MFAKNPLFYFALTFLLFSCGNETVIKSTEKALKTLTFTEAKNGDLDKDDDIFIDETGKKARLALPAGTDVSALVASFTTSAKTTVAEDKVRVMSFNLRFGAVASMAQMGKFINDSNCDMVAIQECDWGTKRKNLPHQHGVKFINELAYHTDMFGIFGKTINYRGGYYGIGILSRYPIIRSERILLPKTEKNTEQRAMLIADIELPSNEIVTFVSLHLEARSQEERLSQIDFLNDKLASNKNFVIVAGDFNAGPQSPEIAKLMKRWTRISKNAKTYPSHEPRLTIDYIFAHPKSKIKAFDTWVVDACQLSDHFPIVSEIEIR